MFKRSVLDIPGGSMGMIYGVLTLPECGGPVPLVILSHGFGSSHEANMDYAEAFADAGFAAISFDFCGGGLHSRSEGSMDEMTVLTEAEDLITVLKYAEEDPRFSEIYLWGESQGGFVSAYVAGMYPEAVTKLALLYPAFVLQEDAKRRRLEDGSFPEHTPFGECFVTRKYNEAAVSFDIYEVMRRFEKPVLILHGDQDPVVPLRYSERAAQTFTDAKLTVLPEQGHGFAGQGREDAKKMAVEFFSYSV